MTINRLMCIEIEDLTPEELAGEFWSMGGDEQALFFDALARKSSGRLPLQLQCVSESLKLTSRARGCMQTIGDYGKLY